MMAKVVPEAGQRGIDIQELSDASSVESSDGSDHGSDHGSDGEEVPPAADAAVEAPAADTAVMSKDGDAPPPLDQLVTCCSHVMVTIAGVIVATLRGLHGCCWERMPWLNMFATILASLLLLATFPLTLWKRFVVVKEWERALFLRSGVSRFGRRAMGPGIFFTLPFVDHVRRCDLQPFSFEVRHKGVPLRSSDNKVDVAVTYHARVVDAERALFDARPSARDELQELAAAQVRRRVGQMAGLQVLLNGHATMCEELQAELAAVAGESWGIEVSGVYLKHAKIVAPNTKKSKSMKRNKKR